MRHLRHEEVQAGIGAYVARVAPAVDPNELRDCEGYPALAGLDAIVQERGVDIPSAVTPAEAAKLQELARGKTVLEVGALLGHSTVVLAKTALRVVSVDPHEGYPASDPRPTLGPFLANLERFGVRDKVTVMVGYDHDVLPYLRRREFGLAFVDCTGEYDVTLGVLRRAVPTLHKTGALCVHDCGHPDWPGALDAAETFAQETGHSFELVDRMAVFAGEWWT